MSEVATWKEKSVVRLALNKAKVGYSALRKREFGQEALEKAHGQGFDGKFGYLLIEVCLGCNILAWKGEPFRGPKRAPTKKRFFTYDDDGFAEIEKSVFDSLFATFDDKRHIAPFRYIQVGIPSNLMYAYVMNLYVGLGFGGYEIGYAVLRSKGRLRLGPDPDRYHLLLM